MGKLLFLKTVDKSLLKAGLTIPVKYCAELMDTLGVSLKRGEKTNVSIKMNGEAYHATLTHVDMKAADRDVFQIRYSEGSAICIALKKKYVSPEKASKSNSYVEICSDGDGLEFKCYPSDMPSVKEEFFKYLGEADNLYGYQKSYMLVFCKCYFQEAMYEVEIRTEQLTKQFRQFYIDRKRAGLITEYEGADDFVINPEKGSVDDFLSLILRNPFNSLSKKGFFTKDSSSKGREYFVIQQELYGELNDEDLEKIRDLIYKKLELFYSKDKEKAPSCKPNIIKNQPKSASKPQFKPENTAKRKPSGDKAWLLTWNPQNWNWNDYAAGLEASRFNESYEVTWSCANTHVVSGDRMYLVILGNNGVRGIIAAGKAISKVFEVPHWDYKKAAKGQKTNSVKVSFEKILDFRSDAILKIETLQALFPDQKWNPQGSGIEIKEQYVDVLKDLWDDLASKHDSGSMDEWINILNGYVSK